MIHHHKCPAVVTTLISLIFLTHFQIFLRRAARCCCPGLRNQTVLVLGADSGAGRCPPGPPLDVGVGEISRQIFATHRGFLRHIPPCFTFMSPHALKSHLCPSDQQDRVPSMTRGRPGATAPVPSDYWAPEPVCNCRLPAVSGTAWLRSPCEVKLHITARVQTLDTRRETGLCAFYHFSLFAIKAKMCWFIATASERWCIPAITELNIRCIEKYHYYSQLFYSFHLRNSR